jgi:hypothetical protein
MSGKWGWCEEGYAVEETRLPKSRRGNAKCDVPGEQLETVDSTRSVDRNNGGLENVELTRGLVWGREKRNRLGYSP